jgi:hypothetical protein
VRCPTRAAAAAADDDDDDDDDMSGFAVALAMNGFWDKIPDRRGKSTHTPHIPLRSFTFRDAI